MDFTALLAQYSGKGKHGFNPIMKYGVLTYAGMRGIREIDRIVELCKRNQAFIWLTQVAITMVNLQSVEREIACKELLAACSKGCFAKNF